MGTKTKVLIIFSLLVLTLFAVHNNRPSIEDVMADFHAAEGRAEDMLMDPLILNADLVKMRVIQDVKNPEMDKRRYAIAFLGNEKITEAIPVLEKILYSESEIDYFRSDALESIYQIDEPKGKKLAKKYSERDDHLGYISRGLIDGTHKPFVRSRDDARIGRHY